MKVAQKRERNPGGTALSRLRLARVAAIVAVAVAVCGYLDHYTPTFRDLEEKTYGLRLEIADQADTRLVDQAHQQVAIVTLPDATFDPAVPGHLPGPILPRAYYAKLIHRLTRDGAKVIAFDILFDTSQPGDAAFANAMRKSGRVLLACEDMETGKPEIVPPTPLLKNTAASLGHTGVPFDAEQPAIDRIQPFLEDDGKPLPAFSVQAACMAGGAASETPTGDDRAFKIWYFGSPGKTFEQIPFQQVISQEQPAQNPFQDKVVVIGYTITTSKDRDQHWTPMGEREMWGVEIQANAIATILTKSFIRDAPPWAEVGTLIVLASAASLLAGLGGLKRTALLLVLLLPAYYYFNIWLFVAHHIDLHLIAPTAMVALTALAVLLERGMTEEQEKTRMRGLLHRYVNPQIAAYILQHPELLGRAGKRVTGTVLFSDIRGFTALSEQIPPEELVSRMNEYFQTMTEIVFRHEGTAASIVGDALLALFGVPVPSPDHAKRAVAAAIEMQGALRTLQERWRLQDRHAFDIGIGINTGEMVVGDVGGRHLMNFTVYGLQVNIASRVESLNKELGTCILITRAAYESVSEEIQARGPRRMSIKGVEEAVEVFEVIGWRNGSHPACDAPEEVNFPMTTHHIYLMAPGASIDDVRRFYGQALGLSEAAKPASLDHNPVLWFQAGSIKFHIGYPEDGIVGDGHTALSVPDLDAARERLSALGYAVDDNIIPMGYPRFYARDPWGNQFEILPEGLP